MEFIERSVLPLVGEDAFGLASRAAILSFVVAFGVAKAFTNLGAGILDVIITDSSWDYADSVPMGLEATPEPFVLRLIVLWMTTICCYGVQVLFVKQRRAADIEP